MPRRTWFALVAAWMLACTWTFAAAPIPWAMPVRPAPPNVSTTASPADPPASHPAPAAFTLHFPTVTTPTPLLVVVVGFPDQPRPIDLQRIENEYFAPTDSVAAYFRDNSFGAVRLKGQVVGGRVAGLPGGPLLLPKPSSAYRALGDERGAQALLEDTLRLLAAAGFDFSPYALGTSIPYFSIVVDIPPESDPNSPFYSAEYPNADVPVDQGRYVIQNFDVASVDDPLGILAHEFGHMLNLVDLYNVNTGDYVVGDYSLYDAGAWNPDGTGSLPSDIDPWQRIVMGWLHPVVLTESGTYRLPADEVQPIVDVIPFPAAHELFILENREPIGWDRGLPGFGLLIWKVDWQIAQPSSSYWQNDVVNTPGGLGPPHDGVQLVDADASGDLSAGGGPGDPFPGRKGVIRFADNSVPAATLLNGAPSGIVIDQISHPAPIMTFHLAFQSGPATPSIIAHGHAVVGFPLDLTVRAALPSGTVGVQSPWGDTSAPLTDGVAHLGLVPTSPGSATIVITLPNGQTRRLPVTVAPRLPYVDLPPGTARYRVIGLWYTRGWFDDLSDFAPPLFQPQAPLLVKDAVALVEAVLSHRSGDPPLPGTALPSLRAVAVVARSQGLTDPLQAISKEALRRFVQALFPGAPLATLPPTVAAPSARESRWQGISFLTQVLLRGPSQSP